MDMIVAKTQQQFEQVADGVQGRLGLVVEDLAGEYRFAVHEDGVFPQASAIKIPILMELLAQSEAGKLDLEQRLPIAAAVQTGGSGVLANFADGESELSLHDLAVMMIVLSDNTATNMLIDAVGLQAVNETMASLDLKETRLRRVMMDTAASARGDENTSTPAEAARVMRLLHEGRFVDRDVCNRALTILRIPKKGAVGDCLPEGVPIAFKPGAIPGVATEWALVELPGRPYLVTVMGHFGVDEEMDPALKQVGRIAYDFFRRAAEATPYGTYVPTPK